MIVFHLCRLSRSSRLRLLADLDDPAAMEAMWEACFWHETDQPGRSDDVHCSG
jgi:hypothetical protein